MQSGVDPIILVPDRPGNSSVLDDFHSLNCEVVPVRDLRPFNGSTVAPSKKLSEKAYSVAAFRKTRKAVRDAVKRFCPDLVHLNSTCLVAAACGAKAANSKLPVVAHVREPLLSNAWGRLLCRLNGAYVDHFIGIDAYGLETVTAACGTVIRNTAKYFCEDFDGKLMSDRRERFGLSKDAVVLSLVARVCEANGGEKFLRLVQEVQTALPDRVRFVVAGFEDRGGVYEEMLRRSIEGSSIFQAIPFVSQPEDLILASDAVVAPFLTAHSSRAVIEASSLSRPSIVSAVPNLIEMVDEGKTGFVLDWERPETLVEAIQAVCASPTARVLRRNAYEFARQNFDAVRNAERIFELYCSLVGGVPGKSVVKKVA